MKVDNIFFFQQIFGAYATHPFKFSDHYYGTGETFLYTFSPNFKVPRWEKYLISRCHSQGCGWGWSSSCAVAPQGLTQTWVSMVTVIHKLLRVPPWALGTALLPGLGSKEGLQVRINMGLSDLSDFITPLESSSWCGVGLAVRHFLRRWIVT